MTQEPHPPHPGRGADAREGRCLTTPPSYETGRRQCVKHWCAAGGTGSRVGWPDGHLLSDGRLWRVRDRLGDNGGQEVLRLHPAAIRATNGRKVVGHCDVSPWNIARHGLPVALIDWEFAGPVDPLVELAQACWLNAKLQDDIFAEIEGLPPLTERARQLRAMVDAYGLSASHRRGFLDQMVE
ncbi:phosphotransferase family protein [Micromonospora fulviviridis]|uniref:Phosphotransferase n=1 Tax=Micromonospora fulviviridis TaxID=47860 RepID=A0ABV2VUR2_9ACTN